MAEPDGEQSSSARERLPDWAPKEGAEGFASKVRSGSALRTEAFQKRKRAPLSREDYINGIREGNRTILARAITIIESNSPRHLDLGQEILHGVLDRTGNSIRVGITGVPGAGKSTFIESLGTTLTGHDHTVAVLAVDPTSSVTGGSILGDKTRMEKLAHDPSAFIRPSPSGGTLGGTARKTRETTLLCEAAGFDVVLIETVGVGQSEGAVRAMTDFFLLLQIPGAGDELQGMKRGVMELADAFLINKAEGNNRQKAQIARGEIARLIPILRPATEGWTPEARLCSALTGEGIPEVWEMVERFIEATRESGIFVQRRREQNLAWMESLLQEGLQALLKADPEAAAAREKLSTEVAAGNLPPLAAARQILDVFQRS